jgi:hypothetical protein
LYEFFFFFFRFFFLLSLSLLPDDEKRKEKKKKLERKRENPTPEREKRGGIFFYSRSDGQSHDGMTPKKEKKKKKRKDRLIPLASTPHKRHLDNVDRAGKMDGKKKTHRHKMAHDLPLNNKMLLKHSLLTQPKLNNNHVKINPKTKEKKVT